MFENWEALQATAFDAVPKLAAAIGILLVGWAVAALIAGGVRRGLAATKVDERIAGWLSDGNGRRFDVGHIASRIIFSVLMLMVAIGVFQALELTIVTEPLNALLSELFEFAPRMLGAAALLLLAWVLATVVKKLVTGAITFGAESRLSDDLDSTGRQSLATSVGEAGYWLVFLLFLPAVLGTLELTGILAPVQTMLDRAMAFLPNLLAAGLIFFVGSFVAKIIRRLTTSLLAAAGADKVGSRIGLSETEPSRRLSGLVGLVAYILVLFPVLISALDALQLRAVTEPASAMLGVLLESVPGILAATVVILLAFAVGRLVANVLSSLLEAAGFDGLVAKTGLVSAAAQERRVASQSAGKLAQAAIVMFATVEGAALLGFGTLSALVAQFLVFAGHLLLGLVIFGIGLALANLARQTIRNSGTDQGDLLGRAAWISVVGLTAAMGLRHMGIANEIIQLAFGLLLGAVAVAVALAFGLGGREVAGRQLSQWVDRGDAPRVKGLNDPSGTR